MSSQKHLWGAYLIYAPRAFCGCPVHAQHEWGFSLQYFLISTFLVSICPPHSHRISQPPTFPAAPACQDTGAPAEPALPPEDSAWPCPAPIFPTPFSGSAAFAGTPPPSPRSFSDSPAYPRDPLAEADRHPT